MKPTDDVRVWQVLNDLRRPGSRLVYNPSGGDYVAAPSGRRVNRADVSSHLAAGHLRAADGGPPGVFVITDAGQAAWRHAPSAVMHGACDACGLSRTLQPAADGLLVCAGCAATRAAPEEDAPEEEPAAAPCHRIAGAAACPGCGRLCWWCIKAGGKAHVQ